MLETLRESCLQNKGKIENYCYIVVKDSESMENGKIGQRLANVGCLHSESPKHLAIGNLGNPLHMVNLCGCLTVSSSRLVQ